MAILGERFCSCVLALATVILASSLVGEAKAQSLPDGLSNHYSSCVGTELGEVEGRPVFFFDGRLQALPAPREIDLEVGIAAGICLTDATGDLWAYDPRRQQFSTNTWHQRALNAQSEALGEQRQAELAAQAAELIADVERAERERRAAVWLATRDACVALYQDNTVAALTNQICQPLFLEIGLPSD